jgi:glycosyltransferase involved in cell wall biosynthesis
VKLLFVVQRYGGEVAGGAELLCRQFATLLAGRGHEVHVLTSCAVSYVDWANQYQPGDTTLEGVMVHRLPVNLPRDTPTFGVLNNRTVWQGGVRPMVLQRAWMVAQGPLVKDLRRWLTSHARAFDVVIFFTYLYYTTWEGLRTAAGRSATVLHPTAHREPQLELPLFNAMLRLPTAYAYSTTEEADLITARTALRRRGAVIGVGVDLQASGDGKRFRDLVNLGDRPYLLFVGRVVAEKGFFELYDYFLTYKRRRPGPLALVIVGDQLTDPPAPHPDIVFTGFVPEATKRDALDGAVALVQPSYFESFSIILSEAWAQRIPALVQGRCDVLAGQARRSGGAIPYDGYAEFEAATDQLISRPELASHLGIRGRTYVEANYAWDGVLARYERLLGLAMMWHRTGSWRLTANRL